MGNDLYGGGGLEAGGKRFGRLLGRARAFILTVPQKVVHIGNKAVVVILKSYCEWVRTVTA
jgi:hypothetical protein